MNKNTVIVSLLGILVVGGIFYWFAYRPTSIRARCWNMVAVGSSMSELNYRNCLRSYGLEIAN